MVEAMVMVGIELVAMWRQTIEEAPRDGVVEMICGSSTCGRILWIEENTGFGKDGIVEMIFVSSSWGRTLWCDRNPRFAEDDVEEMIFGSSS